MLDLPCRHASHSRLGFYHRSIRRAHLHLVTATKGALTNPSQQAAAPTTGADDAQATSGSVAASIQASSSASSVAISATGCATVRRIHAEAPTSSSTMIAKTGSRMPRYESHPKFIRMAPTNASKMSRLALRSASAGRRNRGAIVRSSERRAKKNGHSKIA